MKLYSFTVSGCGVFPYDMLRYDQCWPQSANDAFAIADQAGNNGTRTIHLVSSEEPTTAHWATLLWFCTKPKLKS